MSQPKMEYLCNCNEWDIVVFRNDIKKIFIVGVYIKFYWEFLWIPQYHNYLALLHWENMEFLEMEQYEKGTKMDKRIKNIISKNIIKQIEDKWCIATSDRLEFKNQKFTVIGSALRDKCCLKDLLLKIGIWH